RRKERVLNDRHAGDDLVEHYLAIDVAERMSRTVAGILRPRPGNGDIEVMGSERLDDMEGEVRFAIVLGISLGGMTVLTFRHARRQLFAPLVRLRVVRDPGAAKNGEG